MKSTIEGEHIPLQHSAYVRWLKVSNSERTWYEVEWRSVGMYGYPGRQADFDTENECQAAVGILAASNGGLTESRLSDMMSEVKS